MQQLDLSITNVPQEAVTNRRHRERAMTDTERDRPHRHRHRHRPNGAAGIGSSRSVDVILQILIRPIETA